ncbi:MAG: tetratricopeptide repeat protein [Bacteroidota bacterium]|nr:tetratricopeptide repeat protein [Bacteroidota bacterium]
MKRRLLFFAFLITSTFAFAQNDSADYFFQKGLLEKKNGRRMESLKNFEKAYKYDAGNKLIVTELASAYLDLRKYGQAREKFQQMEQLGDASAETYKQLMQLSFNLKQYDDAIKYATKLKQVDKTEKVNYIIGKVHYDRDNYGEAIQFLIAAAKEEPENGEIPYMIARSYADMMNYKISIPYFEKAISLDQTKSNWIYELGLICYAMHDDKNALKYILMAGEKGYKKDNDYMENLGIAYLNLGKLAEGLKIMEEILKRRPSDMNILNMVAEAYYYSGKYKEAIDYWDLVLFYDKQNASALYMIGMSYQKKGEKEKGVALCDKAIEMDPSLQSLKQKKQMAGM